MLFTDITEIISFVIEMLILSVSMVIVFRSSQFSRPAAKGGVVLIFVCMLIELILTIAEIVLIGKMWVDTFDPDFKDYTHGLVNSIFIMNLLQHIFFLFLYSWQLHLARNCLRACDTHRRELIILNKLKGTQISIEQINIASDSRKRLPPVQPVQPLDSGFLEYDSETTKSQPAPAESGRRGESFQLKDLSNRHIAKAPEKKDPEDSGKSEGFTGILSEAVPEEKREEFVDETFEEEGQPADDFLVFKDDSGDNSMQEPAKDTGRVSGDAAPEKGI